MSLQHRFLDYVAQHQLFPPHQTCLAAISGGVDSIVLAHLLHRAHLPFAIAHCDFRLRRTATQEAALVRNLAQQYHTPLHTQAFNTQQHAKTHQLSIQTAARNLRYDWFQHLLRKHNYIHIATAHHHDDQLETSLYNLVKGTNLRGLQGMRPRTNNLVRPLLFATKQELYHYAKTEQLTWYEDQTNQSPTYRRNWIRHHIIPRLNHINPNTSKTLFTTLKKLQQTQSFFEAQAETLQQQLWSHHPPHYHIAYKTWCHEPWAPILLTHWLTPFGFSFRSLAQWCRHPHQPGKTIHSPTHWLLSDRNRWIVGPHTPPQAKHYTITANTTSLAIPPFYRLHVHHTNTIAITNNPQEAWLDYDKITFPLHIRPWQYGERFQPLGMPHHKKISAYLTDQKLPRHQKKNTYVLAQHCNILWILGHRIDNRFKITPTTKHALHITLTHTLTTHEKE